MEVIINNTIPCKKANIKASASKSFAQRAILLAGLSEKGNYSEIRGLEFAGDIISMLNALRALGADVEIFESEGRCRIGGAMPLDSKHESETNEIAEHIRKIDVGESGLAARMISAVVAVASEHPTIITGRGTLLRRDMGELIATLDSIGAKVEHKDFKLPLTITPSKKIPKLVEISGVSSSQGVSGMLMALPFMPVGTKVMVTDVVSVPYIHITQNVMQTFGIKCSALQGIYSVDKHQPYHSVNFCIEGDWSGASIMTVAGLLGSGISIKGLNANSLQGDSCIIELLRTCGAKIEWADNMTNLIINPLEHGQSLRAFEFDATNYPDLFPALAVLASACDGRSVIHGANRLKGKESDRAKTIILELRRFGIMADIQNGDMIINGTNILLPNIHSLAHGDHRIAMMCGAMALRVNGETVILGSECVEKSYTNFWNDLSQITSLTQKEE